MRAYHEKLCKSSRDKKVGNHEVEHCFGKRYFYYHGNCVCFVDDAKKTYELNFCGYGGSISTKNCLAGYREYFNSIGYTQEHPITIYNYEEK